MINLALASALILVLEGLCYAIMPNKMKEMMEIVIKIPDEKLSSIGFISILIGVAWIWFIFKF